MMINASDITECNFAKNPWRNQKYEQSNADLYNDEKKTLVGSDSMGSFQQSIGYHQTPWTN